MAYIDLVICKAYRESKPQIYQAPPWSGLKAGDEVIVESVKGESHAVVDRAINVDSTDTRELDFIMTLGGEKKLKKILKKVEYKVYEYEEDDNGRVNNI